jgi:hypothetical protein
MLKQAFHKAGGTKVTDKISISDQLHRSRKDVMPQNCTLCLVIFMLLHALLAGCAFENPPDSVFRRICQRAVKYTALLGDANQREQVASEILNNTSCSKEGQFYDLHAQAAKMRSEQMIPISSSDVNSAWCSMLAYKSSNLSLKSAHSEGDKATLTYFYKTSEQNDEIVVSMVNDECGTSKIRAWRLFRVDVTHQ